MDEHVQKAMRVLSLQVGFTELQLRKSFYRVSLRHHPDKGGSQEKMKEIVNARDVCREYLARQTTETNLGPESCDFAEMFAAPSSPPSENLIRSVVLEATSFVTLLGACKDGKMLRGQLRSVLENSSMMKRVCRFAYDCTSLMVRRTSLMVPATSWHASGFKYLSFQGYDTMNNGLRIIDYGNHEYLAVLEFLCLQHAAIWENLNIMRAYWPTLLDLWRPHKSLTHVERLSDVIEIIMGGLRGEDWFKGWTEPTDPTLFAYFCSLCRLIHLLNARLKTGRLKYKNESVRTLKNKGMYQNMWLNDDMPKGVLLAALARAVQAGA